MDKCLGFLNKYFKQQNESSLLLSTEYMIVTKELGMEFIVKYHNETKQQL